MKSHEAKPSSVLRSLNLEGDSQHCCPPVKTLEGTVPTCSPMTYATGYEVAHMGHFSQSRHSFVSFSVREIRSTNLRPTSAMIIYYDSCGGYTLVDKPFHSSRFG